ncbi:MAG TPA: DUF2793 domain-containing protein [Devosiaceae bacterium]
MDQSPRLKLPYIAPSQALKHITHNEAVLALDVLVQPGVATSNLTVPPADPAEGDCHIVASGATGDWAGRDGAMAAFSAGAWNFFTPAEGWHVWDAGQGILLRYSASGWQVAGTGGPALDRFGIHTDADAINRLASAAEATLLTHDGAGHQLKINKAGAADTASVLFQTGWSGRAEFGLAGDDNWHVKVSPDGAAWTEAIVVDRQTGLVSIPTGLRAPGVREQIAADRAYYVDAGSGSDDNDGLVAGAGAFATIQKAVDAATALDCGIHTVTINVAAGTYNENVELSAFVGSGWIEIVGDTTAPANVVVNGNFHGTSCGKWRIRGFRIGGTSAYPLVFNGGNVAIEAGELDFAAASAANHVSVANGAYLKMIGDYAISGAPSYAHLSVSYGGIVEMYSKTVTVTADIALNRFVSVNQGTINSGSMTYELGAFSVTGIRYGVGLNGVIRTGGAGPDYFPGSSAGSAATGGQYV